MTSKMKKRLSKDSFSAIVLVVAIFGLLTILTYSMRTVAIPRQHGLVQLSMPVVPAGLSEGLGQLSLTGQKIELQKSTSVVVLTTEALFFGALNAFTEEFADPRRKYKIPHVDGAPQLGTLTNQMERWNAKRLASTTKGTANNKAVTSRGKPSADQPVTIFLPAPEIPMPIVIQIVAALEASSEVVLATSL